MKTALPPTWLGHLHARLARAEARRGVAPGAPRCEPAPSCHAVPCALRCVWRYPRHFAGVREFAWKMPMFSGRMLPKNPNASYSALPFMHFGVRSNVEISTALISQTTINQRSTVDNRSTVDFSTYSDGLLRAPVYGAARKLRGRPRSALAAE